MRLRMTHAKIAMAHVTECEAGYDGLAVAIVRQAVVDYRRASRYLAGHTEDCCKLHAMQAMYAQSQAFLASSWCGALSGDRGGYILRRLREEEENDRKKKKRKSHKRAHT